MALHKRVLTDTAEISPNGTPVSGQMGGNLQMAESMAYNRQCLGLVGDLLAGYALAGDARKYIKFFADHFDRYRGVSNIAAEIAVITRHFGRAGLQPRRLREPDELGL
jgi:hypothetical protein